MFLIVRQARVGLEERVVVGVDVPVVDLRGAQLLEAGGQAFGVLAPIVVGIAKHAVGLRTLHQFIEVRNVVRMVERAGRSQPQNQHGGRRALPTPRDWRIAPVAPARATPITEKAR